MSSQIDTHDVHQADDDADKKLVWKASLGTARTGTITYLNNDRNYLLSWGDGFREAGNPGVTHTRTFKDPGSYTACVIIDGYDDPEAYVRFKVLPTLDLNATVAEVPNEEKIRVTFHDPLDVMVGRYTVQWTRDTKQEVYGEPESYVERWFEPGKTHGVRVTDQWAGMTQTKKVAVHAKVWDPDFTVAEDTTDPDRYTAKITVTKATGTNRKLRVYWGEDSSYDTIDAVNAKTASHAYAFGDEYLIDVRYDDDLDANRQKFVTVPFTGKKAQ